MPILLDAEFVERNNPFHESDGSRHERMHRTLKEDTTKPPAASLRAQQSRFDRFRHVFNNERPHEGLNNQTPASLYHPSYVRLPRSMPEFIYPKGLLLRRVSKRCCMRWLTLLLAFSVAATSYAQAVGHNASPLDDEPSFILELGAATSWTTTGGAASFAPNLAAETTPIEDWLEIEAGISPFFTRNSTEWDTDFLFKKPWTLSPKAEFMLGVGPEWVYIRQNGATSNSISGEVAGDFMFWPNGKHRFGWYLEPAYDYNFMAGHQQSLGMSAGLLIGLRRKHL